MEYNVRIMTEDDIEEVSKIEADSFSEPWSPNGFATSIEREDTMFLVAEFQGRVVGYIGSYICMEDVDITNVAVDKSYRQNGIANMLLERFCIICKEKRIERIGLEVRKSNLAAIHLYEKQGFENVGIRKNFYRKPTENAIVMNKYYEYEV